MTRVVGGAVVEGARVVGTAVVVTGSTVVDVVVVGAVVDVGATVVGSRTGRRRPPDSRPIAMPSLLPAGEQCLTWRCTLQADDGIVTATAVANAGNATAP